MLLRRRRRHSYQPRAAALGVSPGRRFPALKARFILHPDRDQPSQAYEAGRWPAGAKRGHEPRAIALGWYESGRWPESSGACARTRMASHGARYMSVYILLLYRRCFSAPLARLSKNSVLRRPSPLQRVSVLTFKLVMQPAWWPERVRPWGGFNSEDRHRHDFRLAINEPAVISSDYMRL